MVLFLRCLIISFPGLIALFLILRAFLDANVSDLKYALWLLVILAATYFAAPPKRMPQVVWSRSRQITYVLLPLIGILLVYPLSVVVLIFGETDIAAFLFHLIFDMDGTPDGIMGPYMLTAAIYWGVILITLWRLRFLTDRLPAFLLPVGLASVLIFTNPLIGDLARNQLADAYGTRGTLQARYVEPQIDENASNPNIVLIFLEGLEQTYADPQFGDAYAPLEELGREGIVFSDVAQAYGTGWSLAGTVATTCGVPLMPYGAFPARRLSDVVAILPEVTCFGDILHARGYTATYVAGTGIMGNKMGFYGFDNFLTTHHVSHVIDKASMATPRARALQKQGLGRDDWGMSDELVFEAALEEARLRYASGRPFELTVATMDTHGPDGYTSPSCQAQGMPAQSADLRYAVRCTAELTRSFVRALQKMIPARDLRIVITSDHLAHINQHQDELNKLDRRNTVIYLGGDASAGTRIDTPATMIDVFATTLDHIGWLSHVEGRAGLGVSLLRGTPTLRNEMGLENLNRILSTDVQLAKWLWRNETTVQAARAD